MNTDWISLYKMSSHYLEITLLLSAFCFGTPLNVYALIKVVQNIRSTKERGRFLIFKMHLIVADLFVLFGYALTHALWLITYQFYGGNFLCKGVKFLAMFGFALTSNLLICLSVDCAYSACRIINFVRTTKSYNRVTQCVIVCAYVIAVLCSIPQCYIFLTVHNTYFDHLSNQNQSVIQCVSQFPFQRYEAIIEKDYEKLAKFQLYEALVNWMALLIVYWLPLSIVVSGYLIAFVKLLSKRNVVNKLVTGSSKSSHSPQPERSIMLQEMGNRMNSPSTSFVQTASSHPSPVIALHNLSKSSLNERRSKSVRLVSAPSFRMVAEQCHLEIIRDEPIVHSNSEVFAASAALDHSIGARTESTPTLTLLQSSPISSMKRQRHAMSISGSTLTNAKNRALSRAVLILIAYTVCWAPYTVVAVIKATIDDAQTVLNVEYFTGFLQSLMVVNAILNPLIFGISS